MTLRCVNRGRGSIFRLRFTLFQACKCLCNPLFFNAIKRLTPYFMALRATFPPPEKIFFSALKSCVLNDLKWCNMRWEWKKDEKKFEKSLQVQKKCLPLQSRYETRAPHWGGRVELTGSGKAVRKGSSTGKFIEKTEESTRKQVPKHKERER